MSGLKGKVAIISGASSGIGSHAASRLSAMGVRLALVDRDGKNLEKTLSKCAAAKPLPIIADVGKPKDLADIIDQTVKKYSKIDVLVNSAGIYGLSTLQTTTLKHFDDIFNVNVRSIYYLTKLAAPHLAKTKGAIVNIASVSAMRGFAGVIAYTISKAAVEHLTRCTALELAPKRIRVNAINPGVTLTELHANAGMTPERYKQYIATVRKTHALGRPGMSEDIVRGIIFFAGETSSFITGHCMPIDGGWNLKCVQEPDG